MAKAARPDLTATDLYTYYYRKVQDLSNQRRSLDSKKKDIQSRIQEGVTIRDRHRSEVAEEQGVKPTKVDKPEYTAPKYVVKLEVVPPESESE